MSNTEGMRLFHSTDDLNERLVRETSLVAANAGFDVSEAQEDGKHTLLGKPGTDEVIRVFPDGTWMYEGAETTYMTGQTAAQLGLFLQNPTQYIEMMDED